jgi:hypothetical protein
MRLPATFTPSNHPHDFPKTPLSESILPPVGWMVLDIGDARSPAMQSVLNLKVKYRESFRPFASSVLREDTADWFELDVDSPYMLLVADVQGKRRLAMSAEEQMLFGIEKLICLVQRSLS